MDKKVSIVSPNGEEIYNSEDTQRTIERRKENRKYTPVIIKRNDESVRHPDDILEKAIEEGLRQHKRSKLSLLLSSISAGLILGFAAMSVGVMAQLTMGEHVMVQRLAAAFVYPLGFVVCIMSGTQLFTEQTAQALYPVLDLKIRFPSLLKLWGIVLTGNMIGTFLASILLFYGKSVIGATDGMVQVAHHLMEFETGEILVSSVLAGWLMAQGGWLVMATPPASSQVLCIYIVTFIIGLGGLHHSIAGSAEIFNGLLVDDHANWLHGIKCIALMVLGNVLGGSLIVAILNYGHIKKTQ